MIELIRIAQKFEPFVVNCFAVLVFERNRTVSHRYFVQFDVDRIESQYMAERQKRLLPVFRQEPEYV